MRLPSVRTIPTSQMRSPNQGESPVVSRSKKAKRALERSNISRNIQETVTRCLLRKSDCPTVRHNSKLKSFFLKDRFQPDDFGRTSHHRDRILSMFVRR